MAAKHVSWLRAALSGVDELAAGERHEAACGAMQRWDSRRIRVKARSIAHASEKD